MKESENVSLFITSFYQKNNYNNEGINGTILII